MECCEATMSRLLKLSIMVVMVMTLISADRTVVQDLTASDATVSITTHWAQQWGTLMYFVWYWAQQVKGQGRKTKKSMPV